MVRKIKDATMASMKKTRIHCIALCAGFGENTSIAWTFFTNHVGFESPGDALRALASELVVRYRERGLVSIDGEEIDKDAKLDPVKFIAWVNRLFRGTWGDYGDPDQVGEVTTQWWPFTDMADVLGFKRNEILTIQMLAAEVILAAFDRDLLTDFDAKEISDNLPKIAKELGVVSFKEADQNVFAVGVA